METRAVDLADWLLAHGRTSITTTEAAQILDIPTEQVRVRLHRQVQTQRLFSPARGLWVPIPPQYRSWGVTPVTHFLHDLMTHLNRTYYLGWLSAAELHGASHQRAQVSQIAVDRPTADRDIGRARLRFHTRTNLTALLNTDTDSADAPRPRTARAASAGAAGSGAGSGAAGSGAAVQAHPVPTGTVLISSPELTALDLCEHPARGGGLSNVATVVAELLEEAGLNAEVLASLAPLAATAAVRRLGYLLTFLTTEGLLSGAADQANHAGQASQASQAGDVDVDVDVASLLDGLQRHLHAQPSTQAALLDPRGPRRGTRDPAWNLILNTDVEPDL